MAPRSVLLLRQVQFVGGEEPTAIGGASENDDAVDIFDPKAAEAALQAMKPEPSVSQPPEVSRLTMVQQPMRGVSAGGGGLISGTDKALVVLCANHLGFTRSCYLVYDASTNSLSAVPQIPPEPYFSSLGHGPAILSCGGGAFVLAEIGTGDDDDDGTLYLWQQCTSSQCRRQWDRKAVDLPPQVTDDPTDFIVDVTFSYADSCSCWVDLLKGVLVCDLIKAAADQEPEITFVPLPEGYSIDVDDWRPRPRPEQFRTMSCVNGVIKFVALVGYYENNYSSEDLVLRSWTLSPDLKEWTERDPMAVEDLWASKSFCERNLPKIPPMFPVVSFDEDEVVYLSLKEIERKTVVDIYGEFEGVQIVTKAHHVLRVDVIQNKVLHCTKYTQGTLITSHWPTFLAAEFTSYLHSWKDHEGETEASMAAGNKQEACESSMDSS